MQAILLWSLACSGFHYLFLWEWLFDSGHNDPSLSMMIIPPINMPVNYAWLNWMNKNLLLLLLLCQFTKKGDVVKLFFWVSFDYILEKSKAFHLKSKAFLFYSDNFLTNQKLFVLNLKLFFFLMTRFLQIKSFSFKSKAFLFSSNKFLLVNSTL